MDIIKSLEWRYATKQFDSNKKLSQEELSIILKAINLAPSSYGLQPFKVIIIEDPTLKVKLKSAAFNQRQLTEASQVIVFAANNNISSNHIDDFINRIAKIRNIDPDSLIEYEGMMKNKIKSKNNKELFSWASKQCYLALGFLLTSCSQIGIDACPMEGFDPEKFDDILDLKKENLNSVVIASIGFRSSEDPTQYNTKVRKNLSDLIIKL